MSEYSDRFVALSAALTGFKRLEIAGTGLVDTHLETLYATLGESITVQFLEKGGVVLEAADVTAAIEKEIMGDAVLGPVAQNVIVLWYLGQWDQMPATWRDANGANPRDVGHVPVPAGWVQALVWPAIGAHGMGAKPPGYGSWALPPGAPVSEPIATLS